MISRYNAWLNNVALSEVSPDIYISDIEYEPTMSKASTNAIGKRDGQYSGHEKYVESNKITVYFEARAYKTADRQRIVQDVIAWGANGGWLQCSDRIGQRIYVKASKLPNISSVMRWLDNLSIEFTAYDYPFWVGDFPSTVTLENGATGTLFLPGVWRSQAELSVLALSSVTSINVQVGNTNLILSGLAMESGDVLTLTYTDENHIMEIKHGSTSVLNKRAAESDDDLLAEPGSNDLAFTSDGFAFCTIKVKGVWL